eukprot:10358405-Ditylum_brightwellii.AAC.1
MKKKGWIKQSAEGLFYLPQNLKVTPCTQYITHGHICCWSISGTCCYKHVKWADIKTKDHITWKKYVKEHSDVTFVENLAPDLLTIATGPATENNSNNAINTNTQATVMSG